MVDGSGQVLNLSGASSVLNNANTSSIATSIANSLNSFVPEGYFILQQQFGISPFLGFVLVALMIMMLYYLFAYILFNKLFNDSNLFENIKKPLLVFVFALGVLSAYAVGYLVYIFATILVAVAVSIFVLILILVSSGIATGYRAGNFIEHKVASKEYAAAKERYAAEREMYNAKEDLMKVKHRVEKLEKLLKEKGFVFKTDVFKEYEKSIIKFKEAAIKSLNSIEKRIDKIEKDFDDLLSAFSRLGDIKKYANEIEGGLQRIENYLQQAFPNNVPTELSNSLRFMKGVHTGLNNVITDLSQRLSSQQGLDIHRVLQFISAAHNLAVKLEREIENFENTLVAKYAKTIDPRLLNDIKNNIDAIKRELEELKNVLHPLISITQRNPVDIFANELKSLIDSENNSTIASIINNFHILEDFYKNFVYGSAQSNLSQQHIYRLLANAKTEINNKIMEINRRINDVKSKLARHGANISQIGLIRAI